MKIKFTYPLLVLITFAFVIACSKKDSDTVAPDLATTAAGIYTITSLSQGTTTVSVPANTGYTMTLNRVSNNVVDMVLKTTSTANVPSVTLSGTPATITFQKSYSITASSNGNASGDITNGTLNFMTVESGVTYKLVAKK